MTDAELIPILGATTLIGAYLATRYYRQKNRLQIEKSELNKHLFQQKEAYERLRYETLKFQLTPHAFRNTLSTLKFYTKTANQAVEHISEVLDYILYGSNTQTVSIEQELKFLEEYINLNKLQVTKINSIILKNNIDSDHPLFTKPLIPPLVTAYFVENAFKHGDLNHDDALVIELNIENNIFHYQVINKIAASSVSNGKGGIGQKNMADRLDLLYKNKYRINYNTETDKYISTLQLNLN
jgi:LytS/YehU family sensor histidine kinase